MQHRPIADTVHVVGRRVAASPKLILAKNGRRLGAGLSILLVLNFHRYLGHFI
jgi:hypothetical protein